MEALVIQRRPNLFESNLNLLKRTSQELTLSEISDWAFCHTGKKKSLNLRSSLQRGTLHSQDSIEDEVGRWLSHLNLPKMQQIIVYGIGLGYYYLALKDWLHEDPRRSLHFIEDDMQVVRAFLETDVAAKLLEDPQVNLHCLPSTSSLEQPWVDKIIREGAFRFSAFTSLEVYEDVKKEIGGRLRFALEFFRDYHQMNLSEFLRKGSSFFKNFYHNLLHLPEAFNAKSLEGKFQGIPAIICGAGPSLKKNVECLKTLKDRALIFAGGTAVNALNAYGMNPHFGGGLDPFFPHVNRIVSNQAFGVPYFFRARMHHEALRAVSGPKWYLPGSPGYPIADWVERGLGIEPWSLDDGANVVNMTFSLARNLGCNPIFCVGLDLAYSGGESYPQGLKAHAVFDQKTNFWTKQPGEELIEAQDIEGKPVYTLMKWVLESSWYSDQGMKFPQTIIMNCTEGGIGFKGIPNITLESAKSLYLGKSWDIEGQIAQACSSGWGQPVATREKVLEVMHRLKQSLSKSQEVLEAFQKKYPDLWEEMHVRDEQKEIESALEDEPAFKHLLKPLDSVFNEFIISSDPNKKNFPELKLVAEGRLPYLLDVVKDNMSEINNALEDVGNSEFSSFQAQEEKERLKDFLKHSNTTFSEIEGASRFFSKEGSLLSESWYEKGLKTGVATTFDEKGAIISRKEYKEGEADGLHLYFYPEEKLSNVVPYKEGKLDGEVKLFYSSGRLMRRAFFRKGKREGSDLLFYPQGSPWLEGEYRDDHPIGSAKTWSMKGSLVKQNVYGASGELKHAFAWDETGHPVPAAPPPDFFGFLAKDSVELGDALTKMAALIESLGDSGEINKKENEEIVKTIELFKACFGSLQDFLEEAHSEGKEAVWKTPAHESTIQELLRLLTIPMQKSVMEIREKLLKLKKNK